jgi:hypothetical protein
MEIYKKINDLKNKYPFWKIENKIEISQKNKNRLILSDLAGNGKGLFFIMTNTNYFFIYNLKTAELSMIDLGDQGLLKQAGWAAYNSINNTLIISDTKEFKAGIFDLHNHVFINFIDTIINNDNKQYFITCVGADPNGNIYLLMQGVGLIDSFLCKYDSSGNLIKKFFLPNFNIITQIQVTEEDCIYLLHFNDSAIYRIKDDSISKIFQMEKVQLHFFCFDKKEFYISVVSNPFRKFLKLNNKGCLEYISNIDEIKMPAGINYYNDKLVISDRMSKCIWILGKK